MFIQSNEAGKITTSYLEIVPAYGRDYKSKKEKEIAVFIQLNEAGKIATSYLEIVPAYGRDYKSKKEVLADWKAGKDFQLASTGHYCSINEFAPGVTVNIRYKKRTQVTPAEV